MKDIEKSILNDIKKSLYKEKPVAIRNVDIKSYKWVEYRADVDGGTAIFHIPWDEMTEFFTLSMPAQLLIRWLYDFEFEI